MFVGILFLLALVTSPLFSGYFSIGAIFFPSIEELLFFSGRGSDPRKKFELVSFSHKKISVGEHTVFLCSVFLGSTPRYQDSSHQQYDMTCFCYWNPGWGVDPKSSSLLYFDSCLTKPARCKKFDWDLGVKKNNLIWPGGCSTRCIYFRPIIGAHVHSSYNNRLRGAQNLVTTRMR